METQRDSTDPETLSSGRSDADEAHTDSQSDENEPAKLPLFGVRKRARELQSRVSGLEAELDRLGALSIVELEERKRSLSADIAEQAVTLEAERATATAALERELQQARDDDARARTSLKQDIAELTNELSELRKVVVATRDEQILQEVGVYEFQHPLDDAVAFKEALADLRADIKEMARADGGAIKATTDWTVNGSLTQGRKMVREYSKLMLRSYNAEADNLVRTMKPFKLEASTDRLRKSKDTIAKLGKTMSIEVSSRYHALRLKELKLTSDYLAKVAEEKEAEREEKARLREERKAQQEMERERERLQKERQHYANALSALEANGDLDAVAKLRAQLAELTEQSKTSTTEQPISARAMST